MNKILSWLEDRRIHDIHQRVWTLANICSASGSKKRTSFSEFCAFWWLLEDGFWRSRAVFLVPLSYHANNRGRFFQVKSFVVSVVPDSWRVCKCPSAVAHPFQRPCRSSERMLSDWLKGAPQFYPPALPYRRNVYLYLIRANVFTERLHALNGFNVFWNKASTLSNPMGHGVSTMMQSNGLDACNVRVFWMYSSYENSVKEHHEESNWVLAFDSAHSWRARKSYISSLLDVNKATTEKPDGPRQRRMTKIQAK